MKHINLKDRLLASMASATSQNPMETELLYMLGTRKKVEASLMELYQEHRVGCCKITRKGVEIVVWWPVGATGAAHSYGRNGTLCAPKRVERAAA